MSGQVLNPANFVCLEGHTKSFPKRIDGWKPSALCQWLRRRGVRVTSTKGRTIKVRFESPRWTEDPETGIVYYRTEPALYVDTKGVGPSERKVTCVII